jgi:glutathione S-transferase
MPSRDHRMLKLFYAPGACSLAAHIALEEAGANYAAEIVDLKGGQQRSAEYLQVNPKGRVPALVTDRGILTENPAILAYIAQSFPDARLADVHDPFAFATLQAFNLYLATTVHVAFAHVSRPSRYADGEAAAATMKIKAAEMLDESFAMLDAQLADGRPYVHGEQYSVSDPYLLVFERWFARGIVGHPDRFARVQAHRERIEARAAVRKVLEAEGLTTMR